MFNFFHKIIEPEKVFKKNQVALAYLFGSEARGEAHQESDVDLAILFDKKLKAESYLLFEGHLIEFFSKKYPKKEINLVNLNIAPPLLRQAVLTEGKLLYKKSELSRFFFQMQAIRDYQDYLHLSGIQRIFLKERLANL
ncbi:MAG: nucleotidyltransferase domain-containing protein [bacterium]|nr:nucleotidyltransferase domain-containing protein [bacterium]